MDREAQHGQVFEFKQCVGISKLTSQRAINLAGLKELLTSASKESIAHHTYQYFLSGHALEYTNDFAHWVAESLGEKALSERLSNIDPYGFADIDELRQGLLRPIEERLKETPAPRDAMSGDGFQLGEAVILVFPASIRVQNLAEFLSGIKYVDRSSIYYHFYEARMRLGSSVDDFAKWFLNSLGNQGLAEQMKMLDPFMHTLEGVRAHIIAVVEDEVRRSMEGTLL